MMQGIVVNLNYSIDKITFIDYKANERIQMVMARGNLMCAFLVKQYKAR